MFSAFSVKRPYTVFVAVVLVLVLGVISFTSMTTDLLPSMELPYIIVITTYPGASPEKIEMTVTKPLESVLGTTGGVKNVQSTSSENSSVVMLEFEQSTNMDSAMIELSGNVDLVKANFEDGVSAPMLMKISPDMLPVMVASVDVQGMSVQEVSRYVEEKILPAFERIDGVASVDVTGMVQPSVSVTLSQNKIDDINDKVLASVDTELAKAQAELRSAKTKITDGKTKLGEGKSALESQKASGVSELANASAQIDAGMAQLSALQTEKTLLQAAQGEKMAIQAYHGLQAALGAMGLSVDALLAMDEASFTALVAQVSAVPGGEMFAGMTQAKLAQVKAMGNQPIARIAEIEASYPNLVQRIADIDRMVPDIEGKLKELQKGYAALESGKMIAVNELTKGEITIANTETQLSSAEEQLKSAQDELDTAREAAYKKADMSAILTAEMIGNLLMAQNFSMPAGYITENEEQFLVKVGEQFTTVDELANTLLFHMDVEGVGDVCLSDVASVAVTDNADESYAKINGNSGVILSFQKQNTSSTADVSNKINAEMEALQAQNSKLHLTALMDQGDYIGLVVGSVLQNLLWGGLLAILVLVVFLKDVKPTFIVACSIPFSLLCAITAMYFSKVTLNIISLSGLALGVGMLVDNSIVVIENIYRLRGEGMPSTKAAVLGAKQVSGAIFASTLTTICVFLPIVFTQGISRQLFADMGLTIAYALLASLFVALTLVPAMAATVLRNTKEKQHKWFDALSRWYAHVLRGALRHKALVLIGVMALLVFSLFEATQMGTSFMPAMDSPQMSATITQAKGATKADTYALTDTIMERIAQLDGVETVGAMAGGGGMMMGGDTNAISLYILLQETRTQSNADVADAIVKATADLDCDIAVQESNMDMSALGGSGIELIIRGQNLDTMNAVAEDLRAIFRKTEGAIDISEPANTGNVETRIVVDKDKAMQHNLTVAQVYSELAKALKSENKATSLTLNAQEHPVIIIKDAKTTYERDTLMQLPFTVTDKDGEESVIHLSDIAQRTQADSVTAINRSNGSRTMSVTAGIDEQHNIGLVSRELQILLDAYTPPEGYSVTVSGENESINSALGDLALMLLLAIVFIYLIMVAQFQSLMSPFIVMFTIPLAFTGGLLALWMTGSELSIVSVLGFLVLAGVVVNNGIVFVDTINQLRLEGLGRREAILQTGRTRLRPVLMTALTTILAMSTMAMGVGQGAEMTQPMAIVTIGGLAYATLLTLVVVPILYDIFRKKELYAVEVGE